MKKNTHYLEITIQTPCGESWDDMRPEKRGRHCDRCEKMVVDFTSATTDELIHFFRSSPQNVCGRFRQGQLDRPYAFSPLTKSSKAGKWRSAAVAGGLLLAPGFAAGQQPLDLKPQLVDTSASNKKEEVEAVPLNRQANKNDKIIMGVVTDEDGIPMIGVTILLEGTQWGTISDINGNFTLKVPDQEGKYVLKFSYVGYKDQSVAVKDIPLFILMKESVYTLGEVVVSSDQPPLCENNIVLGGPLSYTYMVKPPKPKMIKAQKKDQTLKPYPNPFRQTLNIRFEAPYEGKYLVQLFDQAGRLLEQILASFLQGQQQLSDPFSLRSLPAGNYILRVIGPNEENWVKQVVKTSPGNR